MSAKIYDREPGLALQRDSQNVMESVLAMLPRIYTNQQVINAFALSASALGIDDYRDLLTRSGLNVDTLAQAREAIYTGPALDQLPNLTAPERTVLWRELLAQLLQKVLWVGFVTAPAGLNVHTNAGTDFSVVTALPQDTLVQVLEEVGEWLFVVATSIAGYVARAYVAARVAPDEPDLAPPPGQALQAPAGANDITQAIVRTWNRYGGLLSQQATALGIDPGVAVSTLLAESGGVAYGPDGRMIIRFESHIFYNEWGAQHSDLFAQHFFTNDQGVQLWRADPNLPFDWFHGDQGREWAVFSFARGLDESAAMRSISMGAAQIMGFNHKEIGYDPVQQMFSAFQASARPQIEGFFRYVQERKLVNAIRERDFITFARGYNGSGQEEIYKSRIEERLAAYQALGAPVAAVAPIPAPAALPLPLTPEQMGGKSLMEADPELYAAWRRHLEAGFENNQRMFGQILNGFMSPYWTTIWMYRILFGIGVASFLAAVVFGLITHTAGFSLIFGGLSAVTMLAYFFSRPLQALEENLQFITWLGIIYNTYWTRLTYTNNLPAVQEELEASTQDAIARIQELMAKHAERSGRRPGLR